jgi:hypothetical protein
MTMDAKQMRRRPLDDEGDIARPDRLEAIAMRRLVAARGFWLSPMHANTPLPRLDGKELMLDISQAHSTAPVVSRFLTGKSVLDRIDNPGQKRNTSTSLHDKYTNHAALMNHERLSSAEREVMERSKEERRKTEIEDKARRMREIEVELLPQLTEEDKARNLAKVKRIKAKADKHEAEQKRLKDLRDKAIAAKRGMTPTQREEADLRRKREQSRERRAKAKAALAAERALLPPPVVAPVVTHLNLEPTEHLVSAAEEAYATPLHLILKQVLDERLVAWQRYCRKSSKPITPETRAEQEQVIEQARMANLTEDPNYLYQWLEKRIIHARSAVIIKREKRRGNLDSETAKQARAAINPMTAKQLAIKALTAEEKADRRRAQNAVYRSNRRKMGKS